MIPSGYAGWTTGKKIPEQRDRKQSQVLVVLVGSLLIAAAIICVILVGRTSVVFTVSTLLLSTLFAVLVWSLRAATWPAALFGGVICLLVTDFTRSGLSLLHSGLGPLILLFLLTFGATRLARAKGVQSDLAEVRRGRRASQILANLGWAGLVSSVAILAPGSLRQTAPVLLAAVLAQATADTLSSEIGQAFGGAPFLLGTWRKVDAGTDGAVTVVGTLAGATGAFLIVLGSAWSLQLSLPSATLAFLAAIGGLFFDSLLGATAERRGWLGNDLVNFLSNGCAAIVTLCALLVFSVL